MGIDEKVVHSRATLITKLSRGRGVIKFEFRSNLEFGVMVRI